MSGNPVETVAVPPVTSGMHVADISNFKALGIALAIGLLIGLERGWQMRDKAEGMRVAGLRTHGLLGLLGGVWALIAQQLGPMLLGLVFLSLSLILLVAYRGGVKRFADLSITGSVASLLTFSLGALTLSGHSMLAVAAAVVVTSLLGYKPLLHDWISRLDEEEVHATLKLLLISVVVLPVLPNRDIVSWAPVNLYQIWWMVVLIAAISYLGYFAIRIAGDRHGPLLTGLCGGLVSSTVVTLNLSRLALQLSGLHNALAAGILTACATMPARIVLLSWLFNKALFQYLWPAMVLMSVSTYLAAFLLWRSAADYREQRAFKLENPFQLGTALKFGALLLAVMILSQWMRDYFGDMGTYVLAAISGIADVDAITLSLAQMGKSTMQTQTAAYAILLAVISNTGFKVTLAWVLGDSRLARLVGGISALSLGLAGVVLAVQ